MQKSLDRSHLTKFRPRILVEDNPVRRRIKVCIVSSCGGHLTEVRQLREVYSRFDHFYVLNDKAYLPPDMEGKTYYITHSERDLHFATNLKESLKILRKERPDILLSTGAGPIVPFAMIGKWFFGCRVVFIETFTRINSPSVTARIMYRLADHFYVQWEELLNVFPRAIHRGSLL